MPSWDVSTAASLLRHQQVCLLHRRCPLQVTPGYPDCAGAYSDRSDCPETCQALRDGVSEQQAEAIRAGGSPFNATISAKKCCSDPSSGNADSDARSLCCV